MMYVMITIKQKGNFNNTENFLKRAKKADYVRILEKYGKEGVAALASATPMDSGETANSWSYTIKITKNGSTIHWSNSCHKRCVYCRYSSVWAWHTKWRICARKRLYKSCNAFNI